MAPFRCDRLTETPTERWAQRTEWNVRDSDGTVIFSVSETLTGGSLATAEFARVSGGPIYISPPGWRPGRPQAPPLRR
jgi:hypothetical protein